MDVFFNDSLVLKAAQEILDEARVYLKGIEKEAYCMELPVLSGATIGQHTRHFIELFQCLTDALLHHNNGVEVVLDYDLRKRDQLVQNDPMHALNAIENIKVALPHLPQSLSFWLKFTDYGTGRYTQFVTSMERELNYNIEHTIHHFALIKIGLKIAAPHLNLPQNFGVAPSTAMYRSQGEKGGIPSTGKLIKSN